MDKKIYNRQEVSEIFGVTKQTVDNWIKTKNLGRIKIDNTVRFTQQQIDDFITLTSRLSKE